MYWKFDRNEKKYPIIKDQAVEIFDRYLMAHPDQRPDCIRIKDDQLAYETICYFREMESNTSIINKRKDSK